MIIKKEISKQIENNYWINKYLDRAQYIYYNKIFLPYFVYDKNRRFKQESLFDLNYAVQRRPFIGLVNSIFNPNISFFNISDMVATLAISTHADSDIENIRYKKIINASSHICERIRDGIFRHPGLNQLLKSRGKNIDSFDLSDSAIEMEKILISKKRIYTKYYERFHNPRYSSETIVFHAPEEHGGVDWEKENSITINHHPFEFELGFFLLGFNYRVDGERLNIASFNNLSEYFNPPFEMSREKIIWLN